MQYKTIALNYLEGKEGQNVDKMLAPVAEQLKKEATGGWRFKDMYTVPVFVKSGCIGRLFGNPGESISYYMLVFEKE